MALANQSDLVGVGMWVLPVSMLLADAQRVILVVVVVRRLGSPVLLRPRRLGGIELDVERVLVDVLRHAVEQGHAVVAGVGADVAADLADVAGERGQQEDASRSLLSLLKNWFGPMPMANSVVPGSLAICRASDSTAAAGAQVISSVVLGSKCCGVLVDQVEDRAAADLLAVGRESPRPRLRAVGRPRREFCPPRRE